MTKNLCLDIFSITIAFLVAYNYLLYNYLVLRIRCFVIMWYFLRSFYLFTIRAINTQRGI